MRKHPNVSSSLIRLLLILFLFLSPVTGMTEGFSGLSDAFNEREERLTSDLESTQTLPLYGGGLTKSEFGNCELLQNQFEFLDGKKFSVYLFDKVNETGVQNFIDLNVNNYFYSVEQRNIDVYDCYILTQFGHKEKKAAIVPNYKGYTMLMIEEGLETQEMPSPIPPVFIQCKTCSGSGLCADSNCTANGKCKQCEGTGHSLCTICKGSGDCRHCDGLGFRTRSYDYRTCGGCSGTGICSYCDGKGYKDRKCYRCSGTGTCTSCKGTKKCNTCGGDGNAA